MRRSTLLTLVVLGTIVLAGCSGSRTESVSSQSGGIQCSTNGTLIVGDSVGHMVYQSTSARVARGSYVGPAVATVPAD